MTDIAYAEELMQKIKEEAERKGIEVGLMKGIEAGLIKGKIEGKIEIVLEMHGDGFSVDKIAKLVKMTVQEVEQIIANQTSK